MKDLISRQALCEYALNQKNKSVTPNDIMRFPSAQPTEASCWGCNCQKMERLNEQKTFSEMVHLHDAETHEERTETHACDLISRAAAIDALDKRFDSIPMEQTTEILLLRKDLRELPSAQPETHDKRTETHACDLISRQAAIEALKEAFNPSIVNFVKAKIAIENLPSAQPEKVDTPTVDTPNCDDTISRQAAIDFVDDVPYIKDHPNIGLLWKAWVERLPSAQPIIRCGQCKYAEVADKEDAQDGYTCQFHRGSVWFSGSYCSWAERRTDEAR